MVKYSTYVKDNFDKVRHLPQSQRFAAIAAMYRAEGHGGAKPKAKVEGKGLIGDIGRGVGSVADVFGLGLEMDKKKSKAKGACPMCGMMPCQCPRDKAKGAGLEMPKKKAPRARVSVPEKLVKVMPNIEPQYAYMTAPLGESVPMGIGSRLEVGVGMGMPDKMTTPFGSRPKRGRKARPRGGVLDVPMVSPADAPSADAPADAPADVSGGGIISSALGMLGLGLPMGVKDKGKMSAAKMKKIVAHIRKHKGPTFVKHLKGAGFFDDMTRGISQGFNMVPGASLLANAVGALI